MSLTKEQILDALAAMSVMDVLELITLMENKFGVSASTAVAISSPGALSAQETAEVAEEKTEFDVILSAIGSNKVAVIKAVRTAISLGLKEAKDMVESAPTTIKEGVTKEESERLKKLLEEAGGSVEIR